MTEVSPGSSATPQASTVAPGYGGEPVHGSVIAPTSDSLAIARSAAPTVPPAETLERADSGSRFEAKPRRLLDGWLVSLITGFIASISIAFYLTPTGQATLTAARHLLAKPTCANQQWLLQVPDNDIFASAYYINSDSILGYSTYHLPSYTIDGNVSTAWLQRLPTTGNTSSYIEWSFNRRYDIRLICVVDGWAEDSRTYARTYPIGTGTFYTANPDGRLLRTGSLQASPSCPRVTAKFKDYLQTRSFVNDAYQWQGVSVHCLTGNVVLYIDGVSRTSFRNRRHVVWGPAEPLTGISEIRFYYCPTILCWLST
jgi:hypothetical protein